MKKGKNTPLLLSAMICIVSLAVMTVALIRPGPQAEPLPFTPPPFDANAQQGIPSVPDGLGWGEVDAQVFRASLCGVVISDGDGADVWLTNPESNSVWLKLRVLDGNGSILGETGIIKPGEYVQTVTFTTIPKEGETIGLKLMAYEPETYYSAGSAVLNTKVSVKK